MSQLAIHSTKSILKQSRKTEFLKFSIHLRDTTVTFEKGRTSYIVMKIIKFLNNSSANKKASFNNGGCYFDFSSCFLDKTHCRSLERRKNNLYTKNIETHITYTDFNIKRIVDQRKKIDIKILCLDYSMKIHNDNETPNKNLFRKI